MSVTESALALLPPEETDPVGTLHRVVDDMGKALEHSVKKQAKYTHLLHDIQMGLNTQLAATLPVFMPFFEEDLDRTETYVPPKIQGWSGVGSDRHIYLDEVLESVREYVSVADYHPNMLIRRHTSGRDQSFDLASVRHALLKTYAASWEEVCSAHTEAVWSQITETISDVAAKVCKDKLELQSIIKCVTTSGMSIVSLRVQRFAAGKTEGLPG